MSVTAATKKINPTAETIIEMIKKPAAQYPEKYCFRYRRDKNEYQVTYAGFLSLVEAFSAALADIGLARKHVAIISEKSVEWISAYFAIVNAGGVAVPLDYDLDRDQLIGFVNFADCEGVIYSEKFADTFEKRRAEIPQVKKIIKIETAPLPDENDVRYLENAGDALTYKNVIAHGRALIKEGAAESIAADTDKMCALIFTSGTTGTSKGVMLSQRNIVFCAVQAAKYVDISYKDVLVSVLPLFHTYEMTAGILLPLLHGCTICLNDSVTNALRDFKYYRPTMMALVPLFVTTIYKRIIDTAEKKGALKKLEAAIRISKLLRIGGVDIRRRLFEEVLSALGGNLRTIVSGGAALNPELVGKFDDFGISIKQGYGITECSPIISVVPYYEDRAASCGRPLEGLQVMIDRENASDDTGEIMVKGDSVMLGYYKNKQATDEVLTSRGWFYTGDCGYLDKDGFLYITGRRKNVIVLNNGKNVFPEEIEEYLENVPLIRDCIVTGRKTENDDIRLTAVIYPDYEKAAEKNLTKEDELLNFFKEKIVELNKSLVIYKQIRNIEIRKTPFPKTSTQKIKRHKVDAE